VLVPVVPLFALALRRQEAREPAPHVMPSRELVLRLAEQEDRGVQNQFNAVGSGGVGFLKSGIVRRITADVVLRGAGFAVRHVYNHANLAGVKTIHSARWVFIDDRRRRLIFASNYDGSLEAYNDDFVDKVWWASTRSSPTGRASRAPAGCSSAARDRSSRSRTTCEAASCPRRSGTRHIPI
jgi:hypothetical protein